MSTLWSQRSLRLPRYTSDRRPEKEGIVRLDTNENPYPPSPMAIQAIRAAASEELRHYPDPDYTELREGISQFLDVRPERIFVGNGSDEVLSLAFDAFFDPERAICFSDITDTRYAAIADFLGIEYREIPLGENLAISREDFLVPSGGVVLSHPNAATGREVDFSDLRAIVEEYPNRVVIVDEAYVAFGARSAVELVDQFPNLLVVRSLSKCRSLAGLRVGFAVGQEDLIAALNTVRDAFNPYPVDLIAQAGALAAMADEEYFRCTVTKLTAGRSWAANELRQLGFTVCDSSASFLFVTHERVAAQEIYEGLRERGILVRWVDRPRVRNYLRISVGVQEDMERLFAALRELLGRM